MVTGTPVADDMAVNPPNASAVSAASLGTSRAMAEIIRKPNKEGNTQLFDKRNSPNIPIQYNAAMRKDHWLNKRLRELGKNQTGLAQALGITQPRISSLVSGGREVKTRELSIIAKFLETSETWVLENLERERLGPVRRTLPLFKTPYDEKAAEATGVRRAMDIAQARHPDKPLTLAERGQIIATVLAIVQGGEIPAPLPHAPTKKPRKDARQARKMAGK